MRAAWRALRRLARPLAPWLSPQRRAIDRIERTMPGLMLQPGETTALDRYPALFAELARVLAPVPTPRILSWGCSTGEEIVTLRHMLPKAHITGVDINPRSLTRARKRLAGDANVEFRLEGDPVSLADRRYDAVLCLAVLRHGDLAAKQPKNCGAILSFAKADRFANALAERVSPGGWLVLANSHFRFTDMAASREFDLAFAIDHPFSAAEPLYGPDDQRLPNAAAQDAIWRKR